MTGVKRRRDGTGSVFKTAKGWVAQVRVYDELAGKSRQVRRRAKNRDHARQLLKQLLNSENTRRVTDVGLTFADYLNWWSSESLPHSGVAPSTQRTYARCLADYGIPAAGRVRLADLTPTSAEKWLAAVAKTRKYRAPNQGEPRERIGDLISASSVRNTYNAAVKALDVAVRDRIITENPLRRVARPKVPRVAVPVTKPDETDRLLVACEGRRVEPLVWFVAHTGVRIGEALALRWADVDLEQGTATIRRGTFERESTKTGRIRTVTLLPGVITQLKAQRSKQRTERLALGVGWRNDENLVFTSVTGRPLDRRNVTHELQRALKAAGVTTARPWHSLRHGLAHRLINSGVPLATVSAILGHSGIAITADTYGHVDAAIPVDVLQDALTRE